MQINKKNIVRITFVFLIVLTALFLFFNVYEGFIKEDKEFDFRRPFDEYPLPPSNIQSNNFKYTALIVEPRKHKALDFVLNNFVDNLDANDWQVVVIHGNKNESFVKDIIEKMDSTSQKRFQTANLGVDNISVKQYSELFFNPKFYDYIPTETFLIFQNDTMIFKENKDKINKFLYYDYVGAPWTSSTVGNGGLSLRRKSKMFNLLNLYKTLAIQKMPGPYGKYVAEDVFFCGAITPPGTVYKPSAQEASQFSVEAVYNDAPFGTHKCWHLTLPKQDLERFKKRYPEVQKLIDLNK